MATVHCLGKTLAKNNKNWIKIILFSVKLNNELFTGEQSTQETWFIYE